MKKAMMAVLILAMATSLYGCAHGGHVGGSVVMKHNDQEAHICIDGEKVKVGEKVALFSTSCQKTGAGRTQRTVCTKRNLGEAEVTEIIDKHFATIKASEGVVLREGLIVERH